jgi:hypothetical protein
MATLPQGWLLCWPMAGSFCRETMFKYGAVGKGSKMVVWAVFRLIGVILPFSDKIVK